MAVIGEQTQSETISGHIKVRKLISVGDACKSLWFADDAFYTATFTGLSAIFPTGEKYFIQSVLNFRSEISDPHLLAQVNGFVRQEANHYKLHQKLNEKISTQGIDPEKIANFCAVRLKWIQKLTSKKRQLAYTVCCEHFLAAFGQFLLTQPSHLDGLSEEDRAIWIWHAIEEIEHKSVAFDVYQHLGLSRWRLRACMVEIIFVFFIDISYLTIRQLVHLKALRKKATWRSAKRFYRGPKGLLPILKKELKRFFAKDFHPWDVDDSELIKLNESKISYLVR